MLSEQTSQKQTTTFVNCFQMFVETLPASERTNKFNLSKYLSNHPPIRSLESLTSLPAQLRSV